MHEVLLEMLVPRFAVNLKIEQLPPKICRPSIGRLSTDSSQRTVDRETTNSSSTVDRRIKTNPAWA